MSHQTPKDTVLFIGIGINSNNYDNLLLSCVCNKSFSFNLVIKCIEWLFMICATYENL